MSDNLIEVYCEDTQSVFFTEPGKSLKEILPIIWPGNKQQHRMVAACCDNKIKDLHYRVFSPVSIRFISLTDTEGLRVYARSLFFLLERTVLELFPKCKLHIMHSVGRGCYAEIDGLSEISQQTVDKIRNRMHELVEQDIPIVRRKALYDTALKIYEQRDATDKIALLRTRPQCYVSLFNMGGLDSYFYGAMVPSTRYINLFDVQPFGDGLVLLMPRKDDPEQLETMALQPKLFEVFSLNKEWSRILQVDNVGRLNEMIIAGLGGSLIKIGEALQEKNFAKIADQIHQLNTTQNTRLILIAGPSSSGKTTFSKRLGVQLCVSGLIPHIISLDNYFVDRAHTPRDEQGNYDFEALEALDVELLNHDLNELLEGRRIDVPKFNFQTGSRHYDGTTMQLKESEILIIEGIHGLNPALTSHIAAPLKFKIYASALTTLAIDNTTIIHTTDNRLLRRMVRDFHFRNRSAHETLRSWPSVRRGEDKHIFPYQEQADVMFNTSLFFELSVLKNHVTPLLNSVPQNTPEFAEAHRLLQFINYFVEINDDQLPPTSILREFLGGSSFDY